MDELDGQFSKLDGDRTPVECLYCGESFPFRECRLFIFEIEGVDEYMFMCDPCHDEHLLEPFRNRAEESGVAVWARETLQELAQSDDPEIRKEARINLILCKAIQKGPPEMPDLN